MSEKKKINLKEKESKLIEKITKAKQELSSLREKRKMEIGKLACKHGLDAYEDSVLEECFSDLSKELADANQ